VIIYEALNGKFKLPLFIKALCGILFIVLSVYYVVFKVNIVKTIIALVIIYLIYKLFDGIDKKSYISIVLSSLILLAFFAVRIGEKADKADNTVREMVIAALEEGRGGGGYYDNNNKSKKGPGVHWVNGYYRSDGTYVNGYWRTNPDGDPSNNFNR